jgi:hypothetical protein
MTTLKTPSLGSISTGTLRLADLVPRFADELERLARARGRQRLPAARLRERRDLLRRARELVRSADWDGDEAHEVYSDLCDALDSLAPLYARFGAHEGDGADFGFWPLDIDVIKTAIIDLMNGMVVSDLSEVPKRFNGEVLLINERGNTTLYACVRGRLHELWSIV